MRYLVEVYASGTGPVRDPPVETFGPFVDEEAASRRCSQLVAEELEFETPERTFRVVEVQRDRPEEADDAGDTGLPPELLTLLQLDPHGEGTVSPELAADICGRDRNSILAFIRTCEEESIEWRAAGREAAATSDIDEADASFHESAAWDQTTTLLRAALRVVVQSPPDSPGAG